MLIDTSVLVPLFRDRSGAVSAALKKLLEEQDFFLTRFTQMELLQGARHEKEWSKLADYLAGQDYLEACQNTWTSAARLYFDLRRGGLTVRSVIDCCIAEIAIAHDVMLLHNDRDFLTISRKRPLKHIQFGAHA